MQNRIKSKIYLITHEKKTNEKLKRIKNIPREISALDSEHRR